MKYELKIALPMYKIIYSMLFMVIIILVIPCFRLLQCWYQPF